MNARNPEQPYIFKPIDDKLKRGYVGFCRYSEDAYSTAVRPLTQAESEKLLAKIASHRERDNTAFCSKLREQNLRVLEKRNKVVVVADGRNYISKFQGYLGDMIETTRLITAFRNQGTEVVVATPNTDIFAGKADDGVEVETIPSDVPGTPFYPWNNRLLEWLHSRIGDLPCLFPTHGTLPLLVELAAGGKLKDMSQDAVKHLHSFVNLEEERTGFHARRWGNRAVHQLQALQIMADLVGVKDAYSWQRFPDAFLYPDEVSRGIVMPVVEDTLGLSVDKANVLFHPGVAQHNRKVSEKFYPENMWQQAFLHAAYDRASLQVDSLLFYRPVDAEQVPVIERLQRYAEGLGLPSRLIDSRVGDRPWSLGSFIAFLQELSRKRGIVLGCDSMPAGHASPATGNYSEVLGNTTYPPQFFAPHERALLVMPKGGQATRFVKPESVARILGDITYIASNAC